MKLYSVMAMLEVYGACIIDCIRQLVEILNLLQRPV